MSLPPITLLHIEAVRLKVFRARATDFDANCNKLSVFQLELVIHGKVLLLKSTLRF